MIQHAGRLSPTNILRADIMPDPFGMETIYRSSSGPTSGGDLREVARAADPGGRLSAAAIHGYLCFSYVPAPETIYAGVRLAPAVAEWRESDDKHVDPDAAIDDLGILLQESVRRDLPKGGLGVYLSGGLDSSLIAALLVEAGAKPELFTLDFGEPRNEEVAYSRRVAKHLGLALRIVAAGPKEVKRAFEPTAAAMEQPFGDGVTVPLYLLGRAAADHCRVVYNGEGGDQLFGGWTNKPLIASAMFGGPEHDLEQEYLATFHRFWGETDRLYSLAAAERLRDVDARAWVRPTLCSGEFRTLLHRLRAANLRLKGAQNIVPRMIQLAACHGLRVRAPFFDRALAEWTFGLPPDWLLHGACEKHLLKRFAERLLPAEVVWREKRGMGVPVTEWCLGALKREIRGSLGRRRLQRDGWFEPGYVGELLAGRDPAEDFRARRLGEKLWALAMLHRWADTHSVSLGSALE